MNGVNGWSKVSKSRGFNGGYSKYKNQIVVLVPDERKAKSLAITNAVYEALGKPASLDVLERGTNVALCPAGEGDGFKVTVPTNSIGNVFYIAPASWRKSKRLAPVVYEAHIEAGMIVFDSAQSPAKL